MNKDIRVYMGTIPSDLVEVCPLLPDPNPSEDKKRILEMARLAAAIEEPVERI